MASSNTRVRRPVFNGGSVKRPTSVEPTEPVSTGGLAIDDLIGSPIPTPSNEPTPVRQAEPVNDPNLDMPQFEVPMPTEAPAAPRQFSRHFQQRPQQQRPQQGNFGQQPRFEQYPQNPPMQPMQRPVRTNDLNDASIETMELFGILDVAPEGHGYLRPKFIPSDKDVYISASQIRRFNLRVGDMVIGVGRPPKESERYYGLLRVDKINGRDANELADRPKFDDLVPIYPDKALKLETGPNPLSTRIIDLIAPIGRGQRGMIVSPPKAGKTWLLKDLANAISTNYPDYHLMIALVGERPEEVTDIQRNTKAEVIASNFDQPAQDQVRVAEVTLERAKRLVEMGKDVVILLDSITRLARAYNMAVPPSGRTLSGGFDPAALFPPKKFLGAARCVEDGGSLTIIGTALVNTDSRMDDLIYEEFKGTGNMELHLDRKLAEKRIYPAIDVGRSGTRNFERMFSEDTLKKLDTLIKMLHMLSDEERTMVLVDRLSKAKDNQEFLDSLSMGA